MDFRAHAVQRLAFGSIDVLNKKELEALVGLQYVGDLARSQAVQSGLDLRRKRLLFELSDVAAVGRRLGELINPTL